MAGSAPGYDVAVVGYGPTGATLANLLCLCGLEVLVLEREAKAYHLPRAVHFDDEVMRVFQTVGIADALARRVRVNPGMRFVDSEGELLMDWPRPQEIGPHGWHTSYRFHQPDLERLLRDALQARDGATVRTNSEVYQLEEADGEVLIRFKDTIRGDAGTASARYVVGCDGARSLVRRFAGGGMEDLGFHERWLVVDVRLNSDMPELGDHTVQFCDPGRPMTYCRSPGNRRRWEITVSDHELESEIAKPDRVWEFLSRWITPADAELERHVVYTFRSAIARRWRRGRLLLAGDAAHLTPPFMGQGMCAGIRDAANLAWKIAACVSGQSGSLLESYQVERAPHVREYITTAIRLGGLINSLDRASALEMAAQDRVGRPMMSSISPPLGEGISTQLAEIYRNHSGQCFPQPILSDSRMLDDRCGYRSALITGKALANNVDLGTDGPTLLCAEEEPALTTILNDLDVSAVFVRPDRYILGTAKFHHEVESLAFRAIAMLQE